MVPSLTQYRAKDAPWYRLGHAIVLTYIVIGLICTTTFIFTLRRENARRDRGDRDEIILVDEVGESGMQGDGKGRQVSGAITEKDKKWEKNGIFHSVDDIKREKGDEWSGYRYVV
jgi:hypothetical protein